MVRFSRCLSLVVSLFLALWVQPSAADQLGSVNNVRSVACPGDFSAGMTCLTATVSCPSASDIGVTVGYITPAGKPKGTIATLKGSGGTQPYTTGASQFLTAGYEVVELAWASEWEDNGLPPAQKSIRSAACRPATLLLFIYNQIHRHNAAAGAMCALGDSGGSGALGYALAAYQAFSYLDKVVLTNGPVFSDIAMGCREPSSPASVTVCPAGQFGCVGQPWSATASYQTVASSMSNWTGVTCAPATGSTTSTQNALWKAMSIADGKAATSFSYPQTAMSGWLCSDQTANGQPENNAAAEGQVFYSRFRSTAQVPAISVNRLDSCVGEDMGQATTSSGEPALEAILNDMLDPIVGCVRRH
jgi:hypothetical protein